MQAPFQRDQVKNRKLPITPPGGEKASRSVEHLALLHQFSPPPPPISNSASILCPKSPSFASSTHSITSSSTAGKICINTPRAASAARECAASISACSPGMSSPAVGVPVREVG